MPSKNPTEIREEPTLKEQMARERTAFRESTASADFAEGTRAFLEKRRPRFTGE